MLCKEQPFYDKDEISNHHFLLTSNIIDLTVQALKPKNHTTQIHSFLNIPSKIRQSFCSPRLVISHALTRETSFLLNFSIPGATMCIPLERVGTSSQVRLK